MEKGFFLEKIEQSNTLSKRDGSVFVTLEFGKYWISHEAMDSYQGKDQLSEKEKALCLQETVKLNREGLIPFWLMDVVAEIEIEENPRVVLRSIEKIRKSLINHSDKDAAIIRVLGEKLKENINPFELTYINLEERFLVGIFTSDEFSIRIQHLAEKKLLEIDPALLVFRENDTPHFVERLLNSNSIRMTVGGWDYYRKINIPKISKNVFIAMAFTDGNGDLLPSNLRDKIKESLSEIGWFPVVVDEVEHNDGIMDKVISSINSSSFIIADLTYQKTGVYYEAGYAKGKGLPVIHIVKKDDLEKCHFDVKHLNLIVWESLEDLKARLQARIKATIA